MQNITVDANGKAKTRIVNRDVSVEVLRAFLSHDW